MHSTFVLTLLTHTIPLLSKQYIQHLLVMLMTTFEILSYCLIVLSSICHSNHKPLSSLSMALVLNTSPHLNVSHTSSSIFSMETVCAGSACCALSQLYTPKQLGSRLLDDTHLLMQNAVLHMHLDLRISKLCTISSAVGLNLPVVGHELSNSDVEQNLHAWSLLFPSFIHVDDLVLSELHLFNMYWQSAAPLELTQISLLDVDT